MIPLIAYNDRERRRLALSKEDTFFVNLGSLSSAHKAEKILKDNSIHTKVGKKALSVSNGCSWGVFVKFHKKDEAVALLRAYSIKIL